MESTTGEGNRNTEDVTGRKKSRFKFLKVRLFGRLKKKDTEGQMKQSQSTGDVTAQEGSRGEDDSEDDCHYPEGALSSRALSHDSIFLADQVQSSQPARVFSQENVHSKIKALQLKLQQQNMRLAPPLLIPAKRMEDSGTTSEDDGLPCSPPEMSFQDVAMQRGASKYPEAKNHLSLSSLTGTGSEEEEQGGYSQPSSRPLSPFSQQSPAESHSVGVDFTSPAQYVPILDNSAARHRLSIKPRNQRTSTRGKKPPNQYRPRSCSMNSLDQPLSEKEETYESVMLTQTMHRSSYASEDPSQAEELVLIPSSPHLLQGQEKLTPLYSSPWSLFKSNGKANEPFQHKDRTNATSHVSSDEITALQASNHTREHLANEPLYVNQYRININEEHQTRASLIPLSICPMDMSIYDNVIKRRTDDISTASSIDQVESLKSTTDVDVSKPAETTTRPNPVPAPRTKKPTSSNLNNGPPKVSSAKPTEAEKETAPSTGLAESSREEDKPLRPSSFRFNVASAKHRSKTSDENVAKQDEESAGNTQKGHASNQDLVVQMEKVESTKSTEACGNTSSAIDKRSSLWREVLSQNSSKIGIGDNTEKSEGCSQNTDYLKNEKAEESEDRRGLFGIKLRSTSLSLRYRSDLPKSEAELKRHSLEVHHILTVKEAVSSDVEAAGNDKKASVLTNPAPQSLNSPQDPALDKGTAKVKGQQISKPSLQPRPQLAPTSKNQPVNQSSQQIPPKTTPRAMDRWTTSNQREETGSPGQSTLRDELLDFKAQSKQGARNSQTEPDLQSPSDRAQPTWMELAKRKSLAWSDKTFNSINL